MLGLIAGQGKLPGVIAREVSPGRVLALDGFPPDDLVPDETFRIETLGSVIADMVERGVSRVVLAGAIGRPPLDPARIDAKTLPLVPRMMQALGSGDDAALKLVIAFFEEAGIEVVGAHQIVPSLLPAEGVLTETGPSGDFSRDLARARDAIEALGTADIGQAVVVRNGQVLVSEGSFGTDWMLESLAKRPDGKGGALFKAPKPDQDRRVDLPTIGPETIDSAHLAGLDGIVIAAGGVMVIEVEDCVERADKAGLFLEVVAF